MPTVVGTEKIFFENSVVSEKDIPIVFMRIKGRGKKEGRDLYGFFVTQEEFAEKLIPIYCPNGWRDVNIWKYEKDEAVVHIGEISKDEPTPMPLPEGFHKRRKQGAFIKESETNVKKKLITLGIPVRKIMPWHRFGWPFSE